MASNFNYRPGSASAHHFSPPPFIQMHSNVSYPPLDDNHNGAGLEHSEELWQECAGPLVHVPKTGEMVWYFPQGHMEQVAASTDHQQLPSGMNSPTHDQKNKNEDDNENKKKLPNSAGLDSQILCRVVHRSLSAELDTDEVYAQISLLPVPLSDEVIGGPIDKTTSSVTEQVNTESTIAHPPQQLRSASSLSMRKFIKILTASDTSTHGGFSVHRKHAEDCLPPLDMSQDPPSQDLVAKDLHGHEWKFRHTFRGHPRRHLLTTGWSVFVSNKRLLAGDAVIFLRGENGELRVGIRRSKCQQSNQQAVMSSHSMHMGVVATANHAIMTRTIFSVFYKPRLNLYSAFLVPVEKLSKVASLSLSVGMRFKMKFEAEDATDHKSCAGTVMGIEGLDTTNWPDSKWRSVKVKWDELTSNIKERPDRVSPWEIEIPSASHSSPVTNPSLHLVRNKRVRQPSSSPTTILTEFPGSQNCGKPSNTRLMNPRNLQGEEPSSQSNMGNMESSIHEAWPSRTLQESLNNNLLGMHVPQQHKPQHHHQAQHHHQHHMGGVSGGMSRMQLLSSSLNSNGGHGSAWATSTIPNEVSLTWRTGQDRSLITGNVQGSNHHLLYSNPLFASWEASVAQPEKIIGSHMVGSANTSLPSPPIPPTETSGCKLFGISLTSTPARIVSVPVMKHIVSGHSIDNTVVNEPVVELSRLIKSDASSEPEKPEPERNVTESCNNPMIRSRIKVIKKGSRVGRGIDLTKFDNYTSLLEDLESMFNMKGLLTDPTTGWKVAYSDREGDTMQVGDDPWMEFSRMVKKLYIISPEEIKKRNVSSAHEEGLLTG